MTTDGGESRTSGVAGDSWLDASLVWDEYKYRHDLCWRLVFQLTAAVVALNIVPYVQEHVAATLHYWVLSLPAIGLALALFGRERLRREHDILDRVRRRHRVMHYPHLYGSDFVSETGSFKRHTDWYLTALAILGIANMVMIIWKWLPAVG
jgi:hypothetical protein